MDGHLWTECAPRTFRLRRRAATRCVKFHHRNQVQPIAFLTQSAITWAPFQETAPRPSSRLRLQCVFIATDLDWTKVWGLDTKEDGQTDRPQVVIRLNS